jgi:predicted ferric reductase
MHWMLEWLPENLAKAGWIAGPNRPRGPRGEPDQWIELAKVVGEWAGYILLALVVIALVRRIPYRWFRLVHKAFGLVFLAGAFHGLMQLPADYWQSPLGWLTTAVAAVGIVPALLSLAGRIGRKRQHAASIEAIRQHPGQLLEIVVRPLAGWPGHRAGQFLFINFAQRGEGAHPFTIASDWNSQEGTLTLAIKALGDFTRALPSLVQPGQRITLEGPYGRFDFAPAASEHQVWVAGGIGVTPFLARLGELAREHGGGKINADFFYSTPQMAPDEFPSALAERCAAAGVRLHRRMTERDGTLTAQEIAACLQPGSSVWFCGPAAWGKSLGKALIAGGLSPAAFHQEAFDFR